MKLFTPSPKFVNLVINHPEVRPTVEAGEHRLDSSDYLSDPAVVAVGCESGVAIFRPVSEDPRGRSVYEGHIFTLPGSRGAEALRFGRAALARLADRSDAFQLYTGVPVVLPAARMYCRRLGLKSEGRDLFHEYFSTEIQQWADYNEPSLAGARAPAAAIPTISRTEPCSAF